MIKFGYTINKSNKIDLDTCNRDIAASVLKHEPSIITCIGCGTCMSTCSSNRYTPFSLRMLQLMVMRGQTDRLHEETKKCMLCGKCQLICPRGVNTRNVILTIHRFSTC